MTIAGFLSLACTVIFFVIVAFNAFTGYKRGILKQLIHVGFAVVSVVASFIITNNLWSTALGILDGRTSEEVVEMFKLPIPENIVSALSLFDMQVVEYIFALPIGVAVMPAIFMALFFIINLLLRIAYFLTANVFIKLLDGDGPQTKIPGLVLGAIEGVLIASVILLPVAGVSHICSDAYDMIVETNEEHGFEETAIEKQFCEYIQPFSENPVLGLVDSMGSETLLDRLASFEDGDATFNMRDEFASMIRFAFVDIPAFKDTNWLALSEQDKEIVDDVVDFVSESKYKASVMVEVLSSMSSLVNNTNEAMDNESIEMITAMFNVFDGIDRDELPAVLNTFKEFYFIASDEGILEGFASGDRDALTAAFTKKDANGETTLSKIVKILNSNERTEALVTDLTHMTITLLCQSAGLDEDSVAKYNSLKDSLDSTVSAIDKSKPKEEQISDVAESLADAFEKNGMTVEPDAVDNMAEYVVENYADGDELSEEELNDIMLNYYQANSTGAATPTP